MGRAEQLSSETSLTARDEDDAINVPIGVDHSTRELIPIRQRPEDDLTMLLSLLKCSCSVRACGER